jgi:hypothetical protein
VIVDFIAGEPVQRLHSRIAQDLAHLAENKGGQHNDVIAIIR